jgi:DNA-binding GntR family transcriptional regulator
MTTTPSSALTNEPCPNNSASAARPCAKPWRGSTRKARRGIYIQRKSKQEILDMITVWAALESMAARLITAEAHDDEITALRRLLGVYDTDKVSEHIDEYSETNISFHQAIIALGKCSLIGEITDRLFMHVRAIRARTIFEEDRAKRSIEDHLAIVEALEAAAGSRTFA